MEEFAVTTVTADDHVLGRADAPVTVLEYGDYECPYCRGAARDVNEMLARYPDTVRFVFRNFPIVQLHPHAEQAAEAAEAAGAQGKFWEMYELLFKNFQRLSRENVMLWAKQLGLDVDKFKADIDSRKFKPVVDKDLADGETAGVYGTPAFYINGKQYNGEVSLAALKPILAAELKGETKEASGETKQEEKSVTAN